MVGRLKTGSALRRTATEVRTYRLLMKLLPITAGALTTALMLVYIVTMFYNKYGSFTVSIHKYDVKNYALSLSEHDDFSNGTSRLICKAAKEIYNIEGSSLPAYLDQIDGEHNGDNYVAYTFYCKNVGTETVTYEYKCVMANYTQGIEKACRIRVIVDGKSTDYAWTRTDGTGPEPGTTPFYSAYIVCQDEIVNFKPDDITKFTVVIWLEGPDDDCVDSVIGGELKVDMTMTIKGIEDTEQAE
ncbi:MAG: hypothetical protein MJ236_07080 [Clostridia bacterium]|nr:hypothetical protein [Clostridia bacterium]